MKTSSKSKNDPNSAIPAVTVGIDLGESKHAICAIDAGGMVLVADVRRLRAACVSGRNCKARSGAIV